MDSLIIGVYVEELGREHSLILSYHITAPCMTFSSSMIMEKNMRNNGVEEFEDNMMTGPLFQ